MSFARVVACSFCSVCHEFRRRSVNIQEPLESLCGLGVCVCCGTRALCWLEAAQCLYDIFRQDTLRNAVPSRLLGAARNILN